MTTPEEQAQEALDGDFKDVVISHPKQYGKRALLERLTQVRNEWILRPRHYDCRACNDLACEAWRIALTAPAISTMMHARDEEGEITHYGIASRRPAPMCPPG